MYPTMTLTQEDQLAYGLACKFLGEAFYKPPQASIWQHMLQDRLFDSWMLPAQDPFTERGLALLSAFTAEADAATIATLADDYAALFVGPARLKAPPWESVYLSRDHILFEKQTVAVRDYYARFGVQTRRLHVEPDDHIGLELQFVGHLFAVALQQYAQQRAEQAHMVGAIQGFLEAHLLKWAEPFLARVVYHAQTDYYRGIAYLTGGTISSLCTALAIPWTLEL